MGISASSLLDDHRSTFITGQAEAELKEFSPYYRKQFSVARLSQVEDELEQQKASTTQLLRQREAPEAGEVLYEEEVLYYDDTRKWRERYVVVRANYCLECHESLETFVKGVSPRQKLLPTGGTVLTTEEKYMSMVNKCFPDKTSVNEDFAPPLSGMPGQFPVYLRLPYRRDSYFCFRQQAKQEAFLSILSDCIRHQNQDFLKKKTCEVQAFLKAIQLYRQDKGRYEGWDMLIGSDVRVMANVVMEQLLVSLEKDMLPGLKAKKTEKKRVWFATVEAAYILVQEHLLKGLSALKEECRTAVRQQEVLIHSDMDQILSSRRQLGEKVKAKVSEAAEKLCSESVQPYLGSVLEELMEPISSGFQEGRQLSENMMDRCQDVLLGEDKEELKRVLFVMSRPNLLSCYQKISSLQEKLKHLQERFSFSNIPGVIHSAQIDLQLLMENAAYTFEQLLHKAVQDHPDNPVHAGSALEKSKHRVLKQYDYDSSTVRKRIFQETLVSITLPFLKKSLAPTCRTELRDLEQLIDPDHSSFIHVENVYESVLLQMLDKEVTKVVKEAASLKKYNLFTESRDLVSRSSRSSLSSPAVSTPGSPAMSLASPARSSSEPPPPSPLAFNPQRDEKDEAETDAPQSAALMDVTPLDRVAQSEKETPAPRAEEVQTVKAPEDVPVQPETTALKDTSAQNETQDVRVAAAPETVIPQEVISVHTQKVETAAEPTSADVPEEAGAAAQRLKTDVEEEAAQTEAAEAEPASEGSEAAGEADAQSPSSPAPLEAPPGGGAAADPPGDVILAMLRNEAEPVSFSETNSLHVSVGSESPPSEVESTEDVRAEQSSGDEGSTTSNVPEDDHSPSPVSSEDAPEATGTGPPQTQTEATGSPPSEPVPEETPVSETVPVPEGAPVPEEAPVVEIVPVGEGAPVPEETPFPEMVPVPEGAPVPEETPVPEMVPVPEPVPVPETAPVPEMVPLAEIVPVGEKAPVPEETPVPEPVPVPETAPVPEMVPLAEMVPVAEKVPVPEEAPSSPGARALDCIKDIRDLVVEVIDVEELVQLYPSGIPKEE